MSVTPGDTGSHVFRAVEGLFFLSEKERGKLADTTDLRSARCFSAAPEATNLKANAAFDYLFFFILINPSDYSHLSSAVTVNELLTNVQDNSTFILLFSDMEGNVCQVGRGGKTEPEAMWTFWFFLRSALCSISCSLKPVCEGNSLSQVLRLQQFDQTCRYLT